MAELIPDLLTPEMGECTSTEITQKNERREIFVFKEGRTDRTFTNRDLLYTDS